ncbi:S9 family peptidase [Panacibacter ginsenosidivorans]|uniref:prolyl oligopeptidase n=1 Tax=Panacibacter ginsenosidivorans TaxID=1813871 RepID=A0A5B8V6Q4_9BACT|nr:prolyl oligopeptidase family serine peptidase [Panacibacter ginsenosidivorans]QEC66431.1 S9 family peptidase [Panacibacter ginsenosidivorans]
MKYLLIIFAAFISMTTIAQSRSAFTGKYPVPKTTDQADNFFGTKVSDPYRWMENDTAADTKDWVKEENLVTQFYLQQIPFRGAIKNRLTQLWNYEKYSAPFKEGSYTYFYKNDGLQNQYILYRQKENSDPEIFLDPNKFSDDGTTSLSGLEFTKDGSLAAYTISEGGADWNKLIVINALTKQLLDDTLEVKFSGIAWKGNEGFYYSRYDKPKEGSQLSGVTDKHKLFYHKLGTKQSEDVLIFGGDKTPRRYIGGYVTEDQHFLVITAAQATYGNELYIQDLTKKDATIVPIVTGFKTEQSIVYSNDGKLFITTNRNAPNTKLVITDAATPTPEHWKDLIPETKFPLSISTCGGKIYAQYLKDAVSQVIQYDLDGKEETGIELPGLGTAGGFSGKKEEKELYYTFTSYIYPPTIFKYDIITGKSSLYKKSNVQFNANDYESTQVFYTSKDGTKIPMIITHKKGIQLNGKNPTLLYGYGGFSVSLTPAFSISNLVFMENGGVYAVPNIRGGGEYGDDWHNAGIKLKKQNVFDDFIAAAEFLIKDNITSKEFLAISGGSNGGLLVGACMTQRPDLFRVCFPAVGVMDMLRYHKFTAGAGWAYDYGTADDSKEMFEYLYHYSPVHNVKKGTCYPATMATTADHDDRVVPAHSFKFAAQLQSAQSCNNPVLIRIESKAGHGAGKPTAKIIEEQADKWSFMFWNMGIDYH